MFMSTSRGLPYLLLLYLGQEQQFGGHHQSLSEMQCLRPPTACRSFSRC